MLKILVAEDDVSTNKLLCAILKINGYEAVSYTHLTLPTNSLV